ncbi:MAG: transcription factor [Desulfuromonadales bacterium]|nr:MAG: transcription factor [Desulfuromonadales bacterium]
MRFHFITLFTILSLLAPLVALGAPQSAAKKNGKSKTAKNAPVEQPPAAPPVNILSIIPAQAEPNMTVTLSGTGFTGKTVAFLGNTEVPTTVVGPQNLTFDVPRLAPGLYALFLKREDGTTSRTYNFSVVPPRPFIEAMTPDTINVCSTGGERAVTITGRNFQQGSKVLFNGSAVRSSYVSAETVSFTVPQAPGGLHQVQIKNPEETITTAMTLTIRATPEIFNVTKGENSVNFYKLIIEGKNFQPGATLVIEEKSFQVGLNAGAPKRFTAGSTPAGEREFLMFVDCSKIVYQRYPADPTDKDLRIQVINPGGEVSSMVQVTAP